VQQDPEHMANAARRAKGFKSDLNSGGAVV
jgi:hypothetical protein